jgi:D-alanyl-D-alanine carboxypeptidase/D-alanyl-D-alanine-endopeptidase (penicillin-binding protein 4)
MPALSRRVSAFTCSLAFAAAANAAPLPAPVARALADAGIPDSAVALIVQEAGAVAPRFAHNAAQPMNPASVMKLVTTYAALELLGPAYTWRTEALARGELREGVLRGELILRGGGDPALGHEQLWLLLRQLRAQGLREIRGDLVLDRSRYAPAPHDPGAFDGEPLAAYNVGPDALLLAHKAMRLRLAPAAGTPKVTSEPPLDGLEVLSLLRPAAGECGDWKEGVRADLFEHGEHARLVLTGAYPSACGEQTLPLGVLDHPAFVLGAFRSLWRELGGTLQGRVRDATTGADALPLASTVSPPLAVVIRDINKFSNNVMARQLLLTLGAEKVRVPAAESDGAAAIQAWLAAKGWSVPELVIENGSGLSRRERISAGALARLLQAAYAGPLMPEFVASLPLLAVDGTLRRRLPGAPVAGRAHVKTGYLAEVRALAGYVLDRAGRRWVVVFLVNHPQAAAARQAQDALLEWVFQGD